MREDCCRGNKKSSRKHEHPVLAVHRDPLITGHAQRVRIHLPRPLFADPLGSIVANEGEGNNVAPCSSIKRHIVPGTFL